MASCGSNARIMDSYYCLKSHHPFPPSLPSVRLKQFNIPTNLLCLRTWYLKLKRKEKKGEEEVIKEW